MEFKHISHSNVVDFDNCTYLFFLNKSNPVYSPPSYWTEIGKFLESFIEKCFNGLTDQDLYEYYEKRISELINEPEVHNKLQETKHELFSWLIKQKNKFLQHLTSKYDIVYLTFQELIYEEFETTNFKGYIDLYFITSDGTHYIFDFKCSKEWWNDYKKTSIIVKSQLGLYKYFLGKRLAKQNKKFQIKTAYVNFKIFNDDIKFYELDLDQKEYLFILKYLKTLINSATNDLYYPNFHHCKRCSRQDCTKRKKAVYF